MIGDRRYAWAHRWTSGTLRWKNLFQHTFGYTETHKKVSVGAVADVLAATATVVAGRTITTGFTNPDVPRCLTITTGGTTNDIAAGDVVIYGTNIEGKAINESFVMADNLNGTVTGTKAFKTVTQVVFPAADNTGATISVGTSNRIGINHRLAPGKTTVVVFSDTAIDGTVPARQGDPTVAIDAEDIEQNYVIPATDPDGTTFLSILYWYHNVAIKSLEDDPDYNTSTSTSSSTSTSTSVSTSTSLSTSSTSISTSSTSFSSTSSSTSTTTAP